MRKPIFIAWISLMFALPIRVGAVVSTDILWLSDVSPSAKTQGSGESDAARREGTREGTEGGADNARAGKKTLWLRRGEDPKTAAYLPPAPEQAAVTLLDSERHPSQVPATPDKKRWQASTDLPTYGYYNAYLQARALRADTLVVEVAKAELVYGLPHVKEANLDLDKVAQPIANPQIPLELEREHYPDERFFRRPVSGEEVTYLVLAQGKPQAGVKVEIVTQEGWRNARVSDADGRVTFTLINDYYPGLLQFKKGHRQNYLLVAEREAAQSGDFQGAPYTKVHYITTLAGSYGPSPYDYRSYAWGLGIGFFVFFFGGLAVYLYRRRRVRPYQDVPLHA